MVRTFQDADLQVWEVYAKPGAHDSAEHAQVLFHCLSDPARRARALRLDTTRSVVAQKLIDAQDGQLMEMLDQAEEIR